MFCNIAWAIGSYGIGPPAAGVPNPSAGVILSERINEFAGLSLDPGNPLLYKSLKRKTVLTPEDNLCINLLAF